MLDLVRRLAAERALPPRVCMHAFGGSAEMMRAYCGLRTDCVFYFSFAACVNERSPKTKSVMASVPADRLLLESDTETEVGALRMSWFVCFECISWKIDQHMERALDLCAAARDIAAQEAAMLTAGNGRAFFFGS
jgi:Tat protein secretion system quality control protein TatD with DNase activity